jgi:hypothetical protein
LIFVAVAEGVRVKLSILTACPQRAILPSAITTSSEPAAASIVEDNFTFVRVVFPPSN